MPEKPLNLSDTERPGGGGALENSPFSLTRRMWEALCPCAVGGARQTWPRLWHQLASVLNGVTSVIPLLQGQGCL